jgi:hypothetical protein
MPDLILQKTPVIEVCQRIMMHIVIQGTPHHLNLFGI